jgi:hypothetical protein
MVNVAARSRKSFPLVDPSSEVKMNEDALNMEVRKYLKKVGVTSQREIEHAVLKAIESGTISSTETIAVKMTLNAPTIGLNCCIEGDIAL